jgi:hypothetical protein
MSVELGLKINPKELATVILLGREDVRDEVIPVEEPPTPEDIQDVKNRGDVGLLNPQRGRAVGVEDRRRGGQLQLLVGKREDGRGELASSSGRGIHHQREMVVVRVQEGWLCRT